MPTPDAERITADARAREAERDGRLPVPDLNSWPTWPFDGALRARRLDDPQPERPRDGEGGAGCSTCASPDEDSLWSDEQWRLRATSEPTGLPVVLFLEPRAHHDLADLPPERSAELGPLLQRVEAALLSLGTVERVHVSRWGDGGAHLHWWCFPRPRGLLQLRGSFLPVWDDLLPARPVDEWRQTGRQVAAAMATGGGRAR